MNLSPVALHRAHRITAAVMAALVLVLAAWAGRSQFGTWDIAVHGYIANAYFMLSVLNAVLAGLRRQGMGLATLILALSFGQTGLGYLGREELEAAAWHIPNGVLLMGLNVWQLAGLGVSSPRLSAAA